MLSALLRSTIEGPSLFTGRKWYAVLVLSVALCLTATAIAVLSSTIRSADAGRFNAAVDLAQHRLAARMAGYATVLRSMSGLCNAQPGMESRTFSEFAAWIGQGDNLPGLWGMGWSAPIAPGSEAETELRLQQQGYRDARLWPAGAVAQRQAILMHHPFAAENRAIGFDMTSEARRRAAMDSARSSGMPVMTAPLNLMPGQDGTEPFGLLVFLAVPGRGITPDPGGHVYASLLCDRLFEGVLDQDGGRPSPITMRIRDTGDNAADADLYRSLDWDQGTHAAQTGYRTIKVHGRTWAIQVRSTPWLDAQSDAGLVTWFLLIGIAISLGLFLLARSQSAGVRENAELYRRSTSAQREAEINLDINRSLASDLDMQSVAQAVSDAGRELVEADIGAFFATHGLGEQRQIAILATSGLGRGPQPVPATLAELIGPCIEERRVVRLDDARGMTPQPITMPAGLSQPGSFMAVPVISRTGEATGALLYGHAQPGHFTAEHERRLIGLATQAAIACDNASLFEAEREARRIAAHRAEDLAFANAELQQFVYVSSHDLQEPLRTITQYLGLLRRRHGEHLDAQAQRYISYAADSATRMHALLNDLLGYSRLGRNADRVPVPLADLVAEVVQDLRVNISETGAVIEAGPLPSIRCDRSKMRLVFQNLIGNALKFRGPSPPRIAVTADGAEGGTWTISVSDNGIGIGPEHHGIIFEVFERLHDNEALPGTGIGLAICKKIIDQHGGRIWVVSEHGKGATFSFTLSTDDSGAIASLRP